MIDDTCKYQTDATILDFSNVFDTVAHHRLIHKLSSYNLDPQRITWIAGWLCGRSQVVLMNGRASDPVEVRCGAPQETILDLLVVSLHINDIGIVISSTVKPFKEDCLIYR